ncbi:cobalt transporter CbiM [Chromatium okenii]|jgi:cobalt/nickel transport system permease protein|uniref:Cobalamin biosynthesis protein CbiM n=1 Tax=Chromatium okenii TaxID=61644 RepID=A0A2S7XV99_9GAMM|nr:cobalt transporter CbiM [Chromatium okenii]PQJ97322.1 cobalamin biosynthesis protein CbiM [Chromatium okenii]
MAHIPDGVLSAPVLIGGAVFSIGLLTTALRRLDDERLPAAAVLSAAFFVSSLITIPIGPTSVHLLLNGLMGLLLGWTAIPALFVALLLQAAFFGYGGILVLGVNTLNMALPALICALLFTPLLRRIAPARFFWIGAAAGLCGVLLTGGLVALSLGLSGDAFRTAAGVLLASYLPLALVEALITGTVLTFLQRVAPELLEPLVVLRG